MAETLPPEHPRLPKLATVDRANNRLLLDGEESPWFIAQDSLVLGGLDLSTIPTVTLTIPVDDLEVLPQHRD